MKDIADVTSVAPALQIVIAIGGKDRNTVVLAIGWPALLPWPALHAIVGLFVNMPDDQTALREFLVCADWLSVLDQQVLANQKTSCSVTDLEELRLVALQFRCHNRIDSGLRRHGFSPSKSESAPWAWVRWEALGAIESPSVRHQTVRSNATSAFDCRCRCGFRIIQIGKSKEMSQFVRHNANTANLASRIQPQCWVHIVRREFDAVVAFPPTRQVPTVGPNAVGKFKTTRVDSSRFGGVTGMKDGESVNEAIVVIVKVGKVNFVAALDVGQRFLDDIVKTGVDSGGSVCNEQLGLGDGDPVEDGGFDFEFVVRILQEVVLDGSGRDDVAELALVGIHQLRDLGCRWQGSVDMVAETDEENDVLDLALGPGGPAMVLVNVRDESSGVIITDSVLGELSVASRGMVLGGNVLRDVHGLRVALSDDVLGGGDLTVGCKMCVHILVGGVLDDRVVMHIHHIMEIFITDETTMDGTPIRLSQLERFRVCHHCHCAWQKHGVENQERECGSSELHDCCCS
mmetsp:Transcript_24610/g.69076  ORF Transcript_24610/g.69076 Transcript_24610/m.69076 type:complete len:515 (+) Transcript_24610:667-2211(+)